MSSDPAWEKENLRFPVERHFTKYYHWVFGGAALWWAPQVFTLAVHDGCCFLLMFLVQDTHCRHCNSMATAGRKRKRLSPTAMVSLSSLEAGPASRPCLGQLRFMTCQDCHLWNLVRWKSWPGTAQDHLDLKTKTLGLNFFSFQMENLYEFQHVPQYLKLAHYNRFSNYECTWCAFFPFLSSYVLIILT